MPARSWQSVFSWLKHAEIFLLNPSQHMKPGIKSPTTTPASPIIAGSRWPSPLILGMLDLSRRCGGHHRLVHNQCDDLSSLPVYDTNRRHHYRQFVIWMGSDEDHHRRFQQPHWPPTLEPTVKSRLQRVILFCSSVPNDPINKNKTEKVHLTLLNSYSVRYTPLNLNARHECFFSYPSQIFLRRDISHM
jgi:hypothetical protein